MKATIWVIIDNGLCALVLDQILAEFLQVISINFIFLTLLNNIQEKILFFDRKSIVIAGTFDVKRSNE